MWLSLAIHEKVKLETHIGSWKNSIIFLMSDRGKINCISIVFIHISILWLPARGYKKWNLVNKPGNIKISLGLKLSTFFYKRTLHKKSKHSLRPSTGRVGRDFLSKIDIEWGTYFVKKVPNFEIVWPAPATPRALTVKVLGACVYFKIRLLAGHNTDYFGWINECLCK